MREACTGLGMGGGYDMGERDACFLPASRLRSGTRLPQARSPT